MQDWIQKKIDFWISAGLDPSQIIIDPGIGFGNTSLQSLELIRNCITPIDSGMRLLMGHSR